MTLQNSIFSKLNEYCQSLESSFDKIPEHRKKQLSKLSGYIQQKINIGETPKAIVICTHNSRRSHIGQLWLAMGADYFSLPTIESYSGGTEATAFNSRAVKALQSIGLDIKMSEPSENPIYLVKWKTEMLPYKAFSKKYEDAPNPSSKFAAIMVCTSADEGCPFVSGCDFRLSLPFEDPKTFDDTPLESEKYLERIEQIGREILYALAQVNR